MVYKHSISNHNIIHREETVTEQDAEATFQYLGYAIRDAQRLEWENGTQLWMIGERLLKMDEDLSLEREHEFGEGNGKFLGFEMRQGEYTQNITILRAGFLSPHIVFGQPNI